MKFHYYPETDSLYVEFKWGSGVESVEVTEGLNVDLDKDGGVRRRLCVPTARLFNFGDYCVAASQREGGLIVEGWLE